MSKDNKNFRKEFNSYMKEIKPSEKLINDTLTLLNLEQQKINQEKSKKNRIFTILANSTFRRYSALACTVLLSLLAVKLYNSTNMEDIPVAPIETTVTPEVTTVTSFDNNNSNITKFSTGTSYLTSYDEYIIETETSTAEFYTNTLTVTPSINQEYDVVTTTQDISENTLYNGENFNTQTSSVTSMGGLSTPIAMGTSNLHNDDDNYIDNVQSNEIVTTIINSEVPNIDTKFPIVDTKPTTTSTHTTTMPTVTTTMSINTTTTTPITTTTTIVTTPTMTTATVTTPTMTTATMTTPTMTTATVTTPTMTTTNVTTTNMTTTNVTTTNMTTTTYISMTIPTYTNITTTTEEVEVPCNTTSVPNYDNDSTNGNGDNASDDNASDSNFGDSNNISSDNTGIENFNMEDININNDNSSYLSYPYTAVRVILKNSSDGYYYNGIVDNDKILKEFPNGSFINSNSIIPIYKGDEYCDLLLIYNDYAKIVSMNTMNFINTTSARISNDYELVTPLLCESFNYSDYNGNNIMGDIGDIQIAFDDYLQIDDLPLTDTRIMNILKNVEYLKGLFNVT